MVDAETVAVLGDASFNDQVAADFHIASESTIAIDREDLRGGSGTGFRGALTSSVR